MILIWPVIILCVIGLLYGWTVVEYGSWKEAKQHWKEKKPLPDMTPLLWIPVVFVLVVVGVREAQGAEYFNYAQVHAGLEWQLGDVEFVQCQENSDNNLDKLGSNLGFEINGASWDWGFWGELDLNLSYTHHSCAVEQDRQVADQWGGKLVWRVDF